MLGSSHIVEVWLGLSCFEKYLVQGGALILIWIVWSCLVWKVLLHLHVWVVVGHLGGSLVLWHLWQLL